MSRPKGSAQFEGDVDKAVKEFVRHATDEDRRSFRIYAIDTLEGIAWMIEHGEEVEKAKARVEEAFK